MDEEDEDLLDIFADDSDPLLSNDVVDEYLEPDKPGTDKSDDNPHPKSKVTKTADEITALAELPNYTPNEKDKDVNMEDKIDIGTTSAATHSLYFERMAKPLSGEQRINSTLTEIISDNRRRENRKRPFNPSMSNAAYGMRGIKQKYMTKNGVQLCLQPRADIATLSTQDAGGELARCLDEPKKILMEDTISILGLDKALELLAETTEIQENGGKTMSDGRIKQPGGVFISLLKQRISEEQMKAIFQRDKQLDNQSKKKRKRMKAKQDKAKVAQMKKRMDKELERLEQKRWDDLKQELPDVKMEKRYGLVEDDDIDEMEVDDDGSPVYDEETMATANENDQVYDNHDNGVNGNHDNGMNGNRDNAIHGNHDNAIHGNHDNEIDDNQDNELIKEEIE